MTILRGEAAREAFNCTRMAQFPSGPKFLICKKCRSNTTRNYDFRWDVANEAVKTNWAVIDGLPYCPTCADKKEAEHAE